ncbi:MAG TPA: hypothetical protein VGY66_02705 [Gemmataceae bacterium]|nr:hypothetical protein [Gemmataceae bacterium]
MRLIDDLMVGGRAHEMARKYGLSRSRVSELPDRGSGIHGIAFGAWNSVAVTFLTLPFCMTAYPLSNGIRLAGQNLGRARQGHRSVRVGAG